MRTANRIVKPSRVRGPNRVRVPNRIIRAEAPLMRGLVAFSRLDEASGVRSDFSGNGLHLTDNNTVGSATGKIGRAANFTAANSEYLSHANDSKYNTSEITIASWFKTTVISKQALASLWNASGVDERAYLLQIRADNKVRFFISHDGLNFNFAETGNILTDTWYFVVAGYDGSQISIEIKSESTVIGTDTTASTSGIFAATAPFAAGARDAGATDSYDGLIDLLGIWNRPLSDSEVSYLYNQGRGRDPTQP